MSAQGSVPSSKPPKVKRQHNTFLYDIVKQLNYDEFKKYTNFAEVMQRVLNEKTDPTEQKRLEHYIKQNFRKNIPNESNWKKGGFVSLKLTDDFYGSETAGRIFQKLYGIKTCKIDLWNQGSSSIHRDDSKNQSNEMEIDLTGDNDASSNDGIYPPKRRIKYPRKQIDPNIAGPSGITTYSATSKRAEQIQMPVTIISDEFNDEIRVSSTESLITDLNSNAGAEAVDLVTPPNEPSQATHKKKPQITVISDITISPPRTSGQHQVVRVGPQMLLQRSPQQTIICQAIVHRDAVLTSTPIIGPKSRESPPKNDQPLVAVECMQGLPHNDSLNSTSANQHLGDPKESHPVVPPRNNSVEQKAIVGSKSKIGPKSKVGPKSQMIPLMDSNDPSELAPIDQHNDSLNCTSANQHLGDPKESHPVPPGSSSLEQKALVVPKSKIGPKSKVGPESQRIPLMDSNFNQPVTPAKETSQKYSHNDPSELASIDQPLTSPKGTLQELSQNCNLLSPNVSIGRSYQIHDISQPLINASEPQILSSPKNTGVEVGSKTRMEFSVVSPPRQRYVSPNPKIGSKSQNEKVSKSASPLKQATTEEPLPKKHCENLPQGESSRQMNTWIPLENVAGCVDESPSKTPEPDMINVFRRSLEAQFQLIKEQSEQYIATSEPSTLSLKNFWCEFVKVKYENDSSPAETQLNNSIVNEEVGEGDDNQSQAILSANHIEDQNYNFNDVEIKMEKIHEDKSESNSSDVEIIEVPNEPPIVILLDSTQELIDNLQVDNNSEEHSIGPFAIPQQPIGSCNKKKSAVASSSKRFLTALPNISNKKSNYQPLAIVVEAAPNVPPTALPNHDFSQKPDTPDENYEIEECTMTDSQLQRYELLNNENTIFLSSQLENYEFNAGKQFDPRAVSVLHANQRPIAFKRSSPEMLDIHPVKRRRCAENVKRELHWKIISIKTLTFKPLSQHIFHLEFQLRNNFDTFYMKDQQSIKRMLHLSDSEWKHLIKIVTTLYGYRYDFSNLPTMPQKLDLPSRIMNCFVQSIPLFVRSSIQFQDFMGHCLEVTEQQPLKKKCVDSSIDSNILKQMIEFKKKLN